MPALPDDPLHSVRFSANQAPLPLRQSVEQLCHDSQRSLTDMEGITLGEIYALACQTYGTKLPEFWRVWKDWHENDEIQDMGEL